jgi:hypothetical protein
VLLDSTPQPTNFAELLERMDLLVVRARDENSRDGYFAVVYRLVTRALQDAVAAGRFEDAGREERFALIFAGRYFDALERFRRQQVTPLSWSEAFRAVTNWRPTVVQHILLGMNAHINFDLGIAAVLTAQGEDLQLMRRDFDMVNDVLAGLTDRVQAALARIWPSMRLLDALGGQKDEEILNFSMRRARQAAWRNAERLAVLDTDAQQAELERIDLKTRDLARKVLTPGVKLTLALLVVRAQERGDVASIIGHLEGAPEVNAYLAALRSGD